MGQFIRIACFVAFVLNPWNLGSTPSSSEARLPWPPPVPLLLPQGKLLLLSWGGWQAPCLLVSVFSFGLLSSQASPPVRGELDPLTALRPRESVELPPGAPTSASTLLSNMAATSHTVATGCLKCGQSERRCAGRVKFIPNSKDFIQSK